MTNWYELGIEEVLQHLNSSHRGLSTNEAARRLAIYGSNEAEVREKHSALRIFLHQFTDLMIAMLFFAALISFAVGEKADGMVILAIVLLNAIIGYIQEYQAEKAVQKLQQLADGEVLTIREGTYYKLPANTLVPGDIIRIEAGNIVPADARLLEVNGLRTNEAHLTGESTSVAKNVKAIADPYLLLADRVNMVFKGTSISYGSAKAVVTATGTETEMGKIAELILTRREPSPLQQKLTVFSRQIAVLVLAISTIIFVIGIWRGEETFSIFLTALSLAVAALPEAFPAIVTVALAKGAGRMVKNNVLIRNLPAVETLGSVNYICTDKTGTLTKNEMKVIREESVEGKEDLFHSAMLLNNELNKDYTGKLIGDSTELAIADYITKKELNGKGVFPEMQMQLSAKVPFDSERMRMSTLYKWNEKYILMVKGAPGKIAECLDSSEHGKDEWIEKNRRWASEGLRVLLYAYREFSEVPEIPDASLERNLKILGLAGLIDPPREEALLAIRECRNAGIKVVMITGDQALTAKTIALQLNILDDRLGKVMTGAELQKMTPAAFAHEVENVQVYARVSPEQKLHLIKALQQRGHFVAMTGDGINDAPSLKQADIGIAMGITGTDVAREVADMILLDDNFATIVKAVKEGRRIFQNIRKFIQYVLSGNLAEILTIFLAQILGFDTPLLPIHILWINLVTDGIPGIALAVEPAEKDIMGEKQGSYRTNVFDRNFSWKIITSGLILGATALATQYLAMKAGYSVAIQQTMVFSVLCFTQLLNALSVRTGKYSLFTRFFDNLLLLTTVLITIILQFMLIYTPQLNSVFRTTKLEPNAIWDIVGLSLASLFAIEMMKLLPTTFKKASDVIKQKRYS